MESYAQKRRVIRDTTAQQPKHDGHGKPPQSLLSVAHFVLCCRKGTVAGKADGSSHQKKQRPVPDEEERKASRGHTLPLKLRQHS